MPRASSLSIENLNRRVCVGLLPLKYRQTSRKAHLSEAEPEPEAAPPSGGVGRGSVLAWPLAGLERSGLGSALLLFCAD